MLHEFIALNRDEIIRRCGVKVATRPVPPHAEAEIDHGVPLFLDQLVDELCNGPSKSGEIGRGGVQHGRDLLLRGFTVSDVVHDYGDVCQSITDMAVETDAPIDTDDFRTLNKCLDDAIAGAVTEHARGQQVTRAGDSQELRSLIKTALIAFEVMQTGAVGLTGTTAALVHKSLVGISALVDRSPAERSATLHLEKPSKVMDITS